MVRLHVARDQPRCAGTGAPALRRLGRRLADLRVIGEAEVVVGAEQQHLAPVEQNPRTLGTFHQPQPPVEPAFAKLLQPLYDVGHAGVRLAG